MGSNQSPLWAVVERDAHKIKLENVVNRNQVVILDLDKYEIGIHAWTSLEIIPRAANAINLRVGKRV